MTNRIKNNLLQAEHVLNKLKEKEWPILFIALVFLTGIGYSIGRYTKIYILLSRVNLLNKSWKISLFLLSTSIITSPVLVITGRALLQGRVKTWWSSQNINKNIPPPPPPPSGITKWLQTEIATNYNSPHKTSNFITESNNKQSHGSINVFAGRSSDQFNKELIDTLKSRNQENKPPVIDKECPLPKISPAIRSEKENESKQSDSRTDQEEQKKALASSFIDDETLTSSKKLPRGAYVILGSRKSQEMLTNELSNVWTTRKSRQQPAVPPNKIVQQEDGLTAELREKLTARRKLVTAATTDTDDEDWDD